MSTMKDFSRKLAYLVLTVGLLGSWGCTKGARAQRLLATANADFNAEKFETAEVEYNNVLTLSRLNPEAIGQLGRIYAKDGRLREARAYLTKALELQPNKTSFQLAFSQVEAAAHNYTNSAALARKVLAVEPGSLEALIVLMDTAGPPDKARQEIEKLPGIGQNPGYHMALGMLALRQQKLIDADQELRTSLAGNPNSSETYFALADLYRLQKKEKEAAEAFKKSADLAPFRSTIRTKYADFLLQGGDVEGAKKMLAEISDKAPDYLPAWVGLMNLDLAQKKYDDAAKLSDKILGRDPYNYEALLGRGTVALATGDSTKAVTEFEHMESVYKKSPQVKYELAGAYLLAQDKAKCVANLNQALALDPTHVQSVLLLAQLQIRGGEASAAVALLTQFLKKNQSVPQAYSLLADAYIIDKKPDSALAVYRTLAKSLPNNPQIPLQMGNILAGEGKDAEARAEFQRAAQLAPDSMAPLEQMVTLDLTEHDYEGAMALAKAQITKTPNSPEGWQLAARVDLARTNLAPAESALLKSIDLDPTAPGPYLALAQVYTLTGKDQEALKELGALVARTNNPSAYMQMGAIQDKLQHYDAARDAYEKVLAVNSNSVAALNNLAYLYSERLNKMDNAYEMAQRARTLMPYNPNIGDTLGWILFKRGDYAKALPVLQDSADRSPNDAEIQFHLGMDNYMMDEEAAARTALRKAVDSPQDFTAKAEARGRLATLDTDLTHDSNTTLAGLEKALKEQPNDPVILNHIGALQEKSGAWDKAAATYETAQKQNPGAVQIAAKLARIYAWRLNQPDKALALAKTAHEAAPDNAEVSSILGHVVLATGDSAWALNLLESAAARQQNQPEVLYDLAWAYYDNGRITDAVRTMQSALQADPAFAHGDEAKQFLSLATAFASDSLAQAATDSAQKILQTNSKYVPALMVSGALAERAGNYKAAQDAYAKALGLLPKFVPAARQLAILDAKHFRGDAAGYTQAELARTAYPDDPQVAESLGILGYYQAKYPRSAELLEESKAKSQNDGEIYYYLGMDYYQLKRTKDSKLALGRALELKLSDKMAADAKQTLASLK